jgi:hypothetical protein
VKVSRLSSPIRTDFASRFAPNGRAQESIEQRARDYRDSSRASSSIQHGPSRAVVVYDRGRGAAAVFPNGGGTATAVWTTAFKPSTRRRLGALSTLPGVRASAPVSTVRGARVRAKCGSELNAEATERSGKGDQNFCVLARYKGVGHDCQSCPPLNSRAIHRSWAAGAFPKKGTAETRSIHTCEAVEEQTRRLRLGHRPPIR